ncbi:MAG TPA: DUF523 domain-containing protein, partial [Kofleriaceae bacterium]|nr:DUF523 domain-containing protein [Kofleriaceae bacterium]
AELVPVCPEVELGLGVPREKIHLLDLGGRTRLVSDSGRDLTDDMSAFAQARLLRTDVATVDGWIFKSRSPSCDVASGRFAAEVRARWPELPIADEEQLTDATALAAFADAVREHHAKLAKLHRVH